MSCEVYVYKRGRVGCSRCGDALLEHGEKAKPHTSGGYCSMDVFPWAEAYAWSECDSYYSGAYFHVGAAWPEGWGTRDIFPAFYENPSYDYVIVSTVQMIGSESKGVREKATWTVCEHADARRFLETAGKL